MDQFVAELTDKDSLGPEITEVEQYRETTTIWKVRAKRFLERNKHELLNTVNVASLSVTKSLCKKISKTRD